MDIAIERATMTDKLLGEIRHLFTAHANEMEDGEEVDFSVDAYQEAQRLGKYEFYVAKYHDIVIGYIGYYYAPNPHYCGVMFAMCDVVYVRPDFRGKNVLNKLMDKAEEDFGKHNVKYASMTCRVHHDFGNILVRRGYAEKEIVYGKEI